MGVYEIHCPRCDRKHTWFSANPDQRCDSCKNIPGKIIHRSLLIYENGEQRILDIGQDVRIHIIGPYVDLWLKTDGGIILQFDHEPLKIEVAPKKKAGRKKKK